MFSFSDYELKESQLNAMDRFLSGNNNINSIKISNENMYDFIRIAETNMLIRKSEQ